MFQEEQMKVALNEESGSDHVTLIVYESDNSFEKHPVKNVFLSSLKSGFKTSSINFIGQGENSRWKSIYDETGKNIQYCQFS